MVTAEDDDDSDNDCLYIDEGATASLGSTSQPQDAATTSTSNELPNSEVLIDFLPLMRNVEILKNIPYIPDVSKQVELKQTTVKIACRDFSRKPFGANEMLNSALYHHLTTDSTMPPNQQHMGTSNGLRAGNQNLKHLLDAPSRPPINPYAPLPRVRPQPETFMTLLAQNDHRTQPNMNMYGQNDPRTQPNINEYVQSDPRNQPNTNVYVQDGHRMDGNQTRPSPNLPNKTSVIVALPGNSAGGTMTYGQTTTQRPANNLPITINGYPVQNGSAPGNQETQIRQVYTATRTEYYGQTTMTYPDNYLQPYRTCELTCPCRSIKSHSPFNPVPEMGVPMSMPSLNPENQAMNNLNHHATNRGALVLFPEHELMTPSSSAQHQSMNSTFNPHVTNCGGVALIEQELMIPSLSPQHQSMNSTFKPHATNQGVPALNPDHELWNSQHQSMNSTFNPHVTNRGGVALIEHELMIPSLSPQHQSINSTFKPHATKRGALASNPGHELKNPSSSAQHQSMNSTFNPHVTNQGVPALNPDHELWNSQHQSMNSTFNPHVTNRGEVALIEHELMIPSLSPQHQSINSTFKPHATKRGALASNPGHELKNPSSSAQHQSMNSTFNPHVTNQGVPALNPDHELWNSPLSPQHQTMNPTFNPQVTSRGALANPQHQPMNQPHLSSIHQHHHQAMTSQTLMHLQTTTGRGGDHQTMNPSNNSRPSPPLCYSCAMGKPCVINPAPSYFNVQPAVPMQNSETGAWNGYGQNYNRNGSIPQNPGYNSEQISKAAYLAALRSQEYLQNATRDILGPPGPMNKKPRATAKQRTKHVKKNNNVNATLAASPICNEPMNNGASTSILPCCTPVQSCPIPNWAAFGTKDSVPKKPTPKTTKAKISNSKKTKDIQDTRVPLEKIPSLTVSNIEPHATRDMIPHIDLTTDLSHKSNTNMTANKMPAPLSIETHKQTVNRKIDTIKTNVTTVAHNMNAINLMQDSSNVEGQSKPMAINVNINATPTHLMEASTQPDTSSNDINQSQINTEQPWIDIKSDGATIPLNIDQQDVNMEINVETTIQPSVIETTTKTDTKNVQNETFLQQASDNIDIETLMALLHADTDEAPTNVTHNSKALAKSTNTYELVYTTSVTTETTSHNIENNDIIMRTNISNSEVRTNHEVNMKQTVDIENTVTVSFVNKIITNPNIQLLETELLLKILNNVKQNCLKEAHVEENIEQTRKEDENNTIPNEAIDTAVDDGMEEDDHKTKDVPDCKNDDGFNIAREKLARWYAIEYDNENKRADYNIKTDTVKIITGPHNISKTTQIKSADISEYNLSPQIETKIENHQDINDSVESKEIKNIKNEGSESAIDELIFYIFQIFFFRLMQEWLSENNQEVYAQKLCNAIHDLIILSDYEDATADLKYECHECHNVTIYSPRQLYYNGKNYPKSLINSAYNCQQCLTFRRQYIELFIKHIKRETSGANLKTYSKQIAENTEINDQKPDNTTDLINERQTHSKPALCNDESVSTNKKKKACIVKEQQGVKTADAPSSSKQVEIKDQKKHNNKNTPDNQNQTNFVVKLSLHLLKESTVEALIQCKSSKSNDNKSDRGKNLNFFLHGNYGNGNNNSKNLEGEPAKETLTTTATVHGNRNISTSLANDNNKENHYSKRKTINAETASCLSPGHKNRNTMNYSTNIQDNNNQERCSNKRKNGSAENAYSSKPDPRNINSNTSSNNNDVKLESHSKKKKSISDETNPELQKINAIVVSKNMDDSDKNHARQSIKRKSLSAEIALTTILGTNTTSDNIDDQNKNQNQHSKRRKSICTKTAKITSPDAQNSKSTLDNNDDNDKNDERSSKKWKSTSGEVAPSKNHNRNTNVSENNDKDHEGNSKRRKSISAEFETRAILNHCHNNCKNKERDREARKNICGQLTTPDGKENCNKDTASKNNEEHETRQPNASKNISDETATSKNDESQKRKTITTSNNDNSNSNKESCNPEINHVANNKKVNNEVRKSIDSETTTNKDTARLNVQDNGSNKNNNNDYNIARSSEATKSTSADILSKKQTTTGSNATSTETTTNNHTENQKLPNIILKIFKGTAEIVTTIINNGEKRHNGVHTDDKKASDKSGEKLNAKEKYELPKVEIPGKKDKTEKKLTKAIAKISDKYMCSHCRVRYSSFPGFEKHLADHHKIVKIKRKDYTKYTTCPYCPDDIKLDFFGRHVKSRHPDKYFLV